MSNDSLSIVKGMIAQNPALEPELRAAWSKVCDKVETKALATRPKPRSFEIKHQLEHARSAFFKAIADGNDVTNAHAAALSSLGMGA